MSQFGLSVGGSLILATMHNYCNTVFMVKLISVNERGALTLPKEARKRLGILRGGQLFMGIDKQGEVTLRAGVVMPIEIYSNDRIEEFQNMNEVPLVGMNIQWKKSR